MNLVEEREAALAGYHAARDFLRDNPTATASNNARFQELYSGASRHLMNTCQLLGVEPPKISTEDPREAVDRVLTWMEAGPGPGDGPVASMPRYPGAGGVESGGRTWRLGAGVVSALEQRGIRFGAELTTSGNVPVTVPIRREPVSDFRAARFVADIIPEEDAVGGRFAFWRQTVRTNNAAAVAPGARKPTSIYTGEKVSDDVTTVAHLSEPVNRFDLEDAAMLRQFLTEELEYGLRLALDDEILNGDGTGARMTGIVDGATAEPWGGSLLATTRNAVTSLEELDVMPSHFVFPPAIWQEIEEEAQTSFATLPALSPLDAVARRLHGFPVVVSNAVGVGTGILGDFRNYAVLYRTGPIRVDWSENMYDPDKFGVGDGGSDFEANQLRFRAELRANIAVLRPAAFLSLDMTAA